MLVYILAIEHGGGIELMNRAVCMFDGDGHIAVDVRLIGNAHEESRAAQVGAGVKIGRVPELRVGGGRGESGEREAHGKRLLEHIHHFDYRNTGSAMPFHICRLEFD